LQEQQPINSGAARYYKVSGADSSVQMYKSMCTLSWECPTVLNPLSIARLFAAALSPLMDRVTNQYSTLRITLQTVTVRNTLGTFKRTFGRPPTQPRHLCRINHRCTDNPTAIPILHILLNAALTDPAFVLGECISPLQEVISFALKPMRLDLPHHTYTNRRAAVNITTTSARIPSSLWPQTT